MIPCSFELNGNTVFLPTGSSATATGELDLNYLCDMTWSIFGQHNVVNANDGEFVFIELERVS